MKNVYKMAVLTLLPLSILAISVASIEFNVMSTRQGPNTLATACHVMEDPHGVDFDLSTITSDEELKKCLLQLAKNLETWGRMAVWLEQQGFSNVMPSLTISNQLSLNAIVISR